MKLAEILAEIMEEWPSTTKYYAQDEDRTVYPWLAKPCLNGGLWRHPEACIDHNPEALVYTPDLVSDWDKALVTKEDWVRERIRLGKGEAVDKCCDDRQGVLYAVNKITKEHVRVEDDFFLPDYWDFVEADPEGWIPWQGDAGCPLPEDATFSYRMKDGETVIAVTRPRRYRWHHDLDRDSDIVAYKPLPESDCDTTREGEWAPKMYEPIEVKDSFGDRWEKGVFLCHHDAGAVVSVSDGCGGFDYLWVFYSNIRPASSSTQSHSTGGGTSGHIHAESMKLYAEDADETEKPWERWQTRKEGEGEWMSLVLPPGWHTDREYRRKPTTITIGGEEIPEPVREPLKRGEPYWTVSTYSDDLAHFSQWDCGNIDMKRLRLGLVHRTKGDAAAHAKALIKVSGGEV